MKRSKVLLSSQFCFFPNKQCLQLATFETDETFLFTYRLDMMTDVFNRMVSLV